MVDMMKKLRQIISLVLVLVMFFDYGAVSASYEPASYAVAAVAGLEELIQSTEPEEIQGEEADAAEAPDLAELPEQPEDAQPGEAPEDAQQSEDPDALLQAERVSPLTGLLNQVSRLSAPYRDDGYIHIYNYDMLSLIGTGLPVEAEDVFHGYADNREADAPEAPDWGEEPEQPAQAEQPEQPAEAEQPEQPAEAEQPEQPAEAEQPEQPAQVEQPEQPAQVEQPEQPAEAEQPEQPAEVEQPEQPAEPEQPEQPTEPDEPEQIAAPEASALPEVPEQIGETLLTQALGRALSRVLVRDTAAPQRAVTATLAAAVAEVTGEEAAPQELAEEDVPAELQGEAQPETDPDPMTDPAQTAAEPALPVAAGESAPDDSDTLPTDAEPAPDAVPAQDSEEPEAPAATGTSPTESDADADTYYNNDENNEESAADPAEPEEIAEPEDGEAAPPAAQPDLIDDPDVVEGPETGDLSQQPDEPVNEPTDSPDEGSALTESKYYYYPNGEMVRYTSDANYYLECDIELPSENCWTLPEDFTGSFTGRVRPGDADRVYDSETDTIFIQNPLQLEELSYASRGEDPLMSGDIRVETFGTGMFLFSDGSQGDAMLNDDSNPMVTYGKKAMLSVAFNAKRGAPVLRSGAANLLGGRDYPGQVTMNIGGTTYILIGDRQQLDAINQAPDTKVYGPVYHVTQERDNVFTNVWYDTKVEMIYPGDADLVAGTKLTKISYPNATEGNPGDPVITEDDSKNFATKPLYDGHNGSSLITSYEYHDLSRATALISIDNTRDFYCTIDADGNWGPGNLSEPSLTYSRSGNYIVFRDIDMRVSYQYDISTKTDVEDYPDAYLWRPLTFTGAMFGYKVSDADSGSEGALSSALETLRGAGTLQNASFVDKEDNRPEISYVKVGVPSSEADTYITGDTGVHGFGFFGTIGSEAGSYIRNGANAKYREPTNATVVKNLGLAHIVVDMKNVVSFRNSQSLVSLLTGSLGTLLTDLLNRVLSVLLARPGGIDFTQFLNLGDLLNPNRTSGASLAAGGFAGIISGKALVEGCAADCVAVKTNVTLYESGGWNGTEKKEGHVVVGKGGFAGRISGASVYGIPDYDDEESSIPAGLVPLIGLLNGLLMAVDELTITLGSLLNGTVAIGGFSFAIPGLSQLLGAVGLGDVVFLLTDNLLNLGAAIPIGYRLPTVRDCTVRRVMLTTEKASNGVGKYGVGGFAGEICGSKVENCGVLDSDYLVVDAEKFGGGFAGIMRDDVMGNLLSGLGIDFGSNKPTSRAISCFIQDSDIIVQGATGLGGFLGHLSGSHTINCDVDAASRLVVESFREAQLEKENKNDFVGGFIGQVSQKAGIGAGSNLEGGTDLLGTVMDLLSALLGTSGGSGGNSLLSLNQAGQHAGVMGCQVHGAVEVKTGGSYAGGFIGEGRAMLLTSSTPENLRCLRIYENATDAELPQVPPRCNVIWNLVDVTAEGNYAGGICGKADVGSTVGALNGMLGLDLSLFAKDEDYLSNYRFKVSETTVRGISLDDYRNVYYAATRSENYTKCHDEGEPVTNHTDGYIESKEFESQNTPRMRLAHNKDGYTVKGASFVGGGFGLATGGTILDVALENLAAVRGGNNVGGCSGATAPGEIAAEDSANLSLLGLNIANIDSLLSVGANQRTHYIRVNIKGNEEGFVVEATNPGSSTAGVAPVVAGGFAGVANSVQVDDCHVWNLKYVKANRQDGVVGGFVGQSTIGGLANLAKGDTSVLSGNDQALANLGNLVSAVPYMVPKFNGCHVDYVNNGYVEGYCAGGFAGEFQSGFVNKETTNDGDGNKFTAQTDEQGTYYTYDTITDCGCNTPDTHGNLHDGDCTCYCCEAGRGAYRYGIPEYPWAVENIGHVRGGGYAGGWGGKVFSGALANVGGGGLSLLKGLGLSLNDLLSAFESYVPMIQYAGVKSCSDYEDENYTSHSTGAEPLNNGFAVYAADDYAAPGDPAVEGYAGGYIGYGSGVQISYCDVTYLKSGVIAHPEYLEAVDGSEYMSDDNFHFKDQNGAFSVAPELMEYAVAGAHYAGGYIGHMNVGSSAALGENLSVLGNTIQLTNLVSALNVVVSTVEHSDVVGAPGGFNIIASPRINAPQGHFGKDEYGSDSADSNMDDGEGVAYAGGFVALMTGGHTQDSNVSNFEYIVGEVAAGGYVGEMEPGSVADALGGSQSILGSLVGLDNVASLLSDFVPTIRNSQTTCVPCGGAVRAQSPSDRDAHTKDSTTHAITSRGMAGGYVGHMVGGQIWGFDTHEWRTQTQDSTRTYVQQRGAVDGNDQPVMVEVYEQTDINPNHVVKDSDGNAYLLYKVVGSPAQGNDYIGELRSMGSGYFYAEKDETNGTIVYHSYELHFDSLYEDPPAYYSNQALDDNGNPTRQENTPKPVMVGGSVKQVQWNVFDYRDGDNNIVYSGGTPVKVTVRAYHDYGNLNLGLPNGADLIEPLRQCAAIRIRSVYGREYAGGYCGRLESGSQVDTGSVSLLGSLVDVSNVLSALEVAYSTISFGYVNGPMRGGDATVYTVAEATPPLSDKVFDRPFEHIDYKMFMKWYRYVGQYGSLNFYQLPNGLENMTMAQYYAWLEDTNNANAISDFGEWLLQYVYGFNVRAGRGSATLEHPDAKDGFEVYDATSLSMSSCAGGFVGAMWSGVIHDSESVDAKYILAMRAAGGFAGEMDTKGLASAGTVSLLGGLIPLNLGSTLAIGEVLVPSVTRSGVTGYQRGLTVEATGTNSAQAKNSLVGCAGGFVGASYGGQIGLPDEDEVGPGDNVLEPGGNGNLVSTKHDRDEDYRIRHPYHPEDEDRLDQPAEAVSPVPENRGTTRRPDWFSITPGATVWVNYLLEVTGAKAVGGFLGVSRSGAVLGADTSSTTTGPLQGLLDGVLNNPSQLISVLDAVQGTVKSTVVNGLPYDKAIDGVNDADYGIVVNGIYQSAHSGEVCAKWAGGFGGLLEATVVGQRKAPDDDEIDQTQKYEKKYLNYIQNNIYDFNVVNKLRGVYGGEFAGGFFGFADTGDLANVGGDGSGGGLNVLDLLSTNVTVLDAFRTYIYYSEANGVEDGLRVIAKTSDILYDLGGASLRESGAAGGFGGMMNNGTIEHSKVTNLNYVQAANYAAGFIGFIGKNEAISLPGTSIDADLLTFLTPLPVVGPLVSTLQGGLSTLANIQALSIVGATIVDCHVKGYGEKKNASDPETNKGIDIITTNRQGNISTGNVTAAEQVRTGAISAGFAGYADLTQIEDCTVTRLKKVTSKQIAAGFLGRGTCYSLVDVQLDNALVQALLTVLGFLLFDVLHLDALEDISLIDADQFKWLGLRLLSDGDLLMLNLFGLQIGVALGSVDTSGNKHITVRIGSSTIDLAMNSSGNFSGDSSGISLNLFESNRTAVRGCLASGVIDGYDVHGDGYEEQDTDGDGLDNDDSGLRNNNIWGYAGGFVGFHESSFFSHNEMLYCDVVAGTKTANKTMTVTSPYWITPYHVGPFSGGYVINSNTRDIDYFEQNSNVYHIYRNISPKVYTAVTTGGTLLGKDDKLATELVRYNAEHRIANSTYSDPDYLTDAAYHGVYNFRGDDTTSNGSPYLKNAYYDGYPNVPLDAYISDGKALLMEGKILEENTPHEVFKPQDLNDPCEEFQLTLEKEWDHGAIPEDERADKITFNVLRVTTHQKPTTVLGIGAPPADPQPVATAQVGTYVLTEADAMLSGTTILKDHWIREHLDPTVVDDGWRVWGTDADLPTPKLADGTTWDGAKVFRSKLSGELDLNGSGEPIPVADSGVTLYFKSKHPDKYITGESVDLYYLDGSDGKYHRAYICLTDSDDYLTYTSDVYNGTPDMDGGLKHYSDATTGAEFWIDSSFHLKKYRFIEPNNQSRYVEVTFDDDGKVTGATEYIGGTGTGLSKNADGSYTTYDNPLVENDGKSFLVEYNPSTGLLQLDYDYDGVDTDSRVTRVKVEGDEFFGFDKDGNLVHYIYRKGETDAIDITIPEGEEGKDWFTSGAMPGLAAGVTEPHYVFAYEHETGHVTLYTNQPALTFTGDAYQDVQLEVAQDDQLYGFDAFGNLLIFQYANPEDSDDQFEIRIVKDAVTGERTLDGTAKLLPGGTDADIDENGRFNSANYRYTVRYDAETERVEVNYLSQADLTELPTCVYRQAEGNETFWLDGQNRLLKYRYKVSDNQYLDVWFDAETGAPTKANDSGAAQDLDIETVEDTYAVAWDDQNNPTQTVTEHTYLLRTKKTPANTGPLVAVLQYENGVISLDYDTLALNANNSADYDAASAQTYKVYYKEMKDEKGGTHTFFYNYDGELVYYTFDDPDGGTYSTAIDPTKAVDTVSSSNNSYTSNGTQKRVDWKYVKTTDVPKTKSDGTPVLDPDTNQPIVETVSTRKFTMGYNLPGEYPIVAEDYVADSVDDVAYYDLEGNLLKYRYYVPDTQGTNPGVLGIGSYKYQQVVDFTFDPATGEITSAESYSVNIKDSAHPKTDDIAAKPNALDPVSEDDGRPSTGSFASTNGTTQYAFFTTENGISYLAYNPTTKKLTIQKDTPGHKAVYADTYDDSENDNTSTFAYGPDGTLLYYELDHDPNLSTNDFTYSIPVSNGATGTPKKTGDGAAYNPIQLTYVEGDPADTTDDKWIAAYSPNGAALGNYDGSTWTWSDSTEAGNVLSDAGTSTADILSKAPDVVFLSCYRNTKTGNNTKWVIVGYDKDGNARYVNGRKRTESSNYDFEFTLNADRTLSTEYVKPNSNVQHTYVDKNNNPITMSTNPDTDLVKDTWGYAIENGWVKVVYKVDRTIGAADDEFKSASFVKSAPVKKSFTPDFDYTLQSSYTPDFQSTLAEPEPEYSVAVPAGAAKYHARPADLLKPTRDGYYNAPTATYTHKLARIVGVPQYEKGEGNVYYSYWVSEDLGVFEDDYYLEDSRVDQAHGTVWMKNKAIVYNIILDKFKDGDEDIKLPGAKFKLYKNTGSGVLWYHNKKGLGNSLGRALNQNAKTLDTDKLAGALISSTDKTLKWNPSMTILKVAKSGVNYTFQAVNLGTDLYLAVQGAKLTFASTPTAWTLEDAQDGYWYIKQAGTDNALTYDDGFGVSGFVDGNDAFRFLIFNDKDGAPMVTDSSSPAYRLKYLAEEEPEADDEILIYFPMFVNQNASDVEWIASEADATEAVTDANGYAAFPFLSKGTYYLKETEAPEGYQLLKDPIQVLVKKTGPNDPNPGDKFEIDDAEVDPYDSGVYNIKVHIPNGGNKIVVDKFEAGDRSQKLAGAKFILYRYPTEKELTAYGGMTSEEKQEKYGDVILTATTPMYYFLNESDKVEYTTDRTKAWEAITDSNGYAEFIDLDEGEYYLMETEAPVDYRRMQDVVKLNVVAGGGANTGTDFVLVTEPDGNTVVAHVPNIPDSSLPDTGGEGAAWIQGAAIALLTLGGAYLLYNALRKRREQDPDHPAA